MSIILAIWIVLIASLLILKFNYGVFLYLAYILLVPYMQIHVGVTLSWNLINLILIFAICIQCKRKKIIIDWTLMKPFFFLYGMQLLMIPFQSDVPLGFMLNAYRTTLMTTLIVPVSLIVVNKSDIDGRKKLMYIVAVCIIIATVYGLLLTRTQGINPYLMLMCYLNDIDYLGSYFMAENEGRLFGRISSVFSHPMTYAFFLGISFIFIYSLKGQINKKVKYFILGLIVVNSVTCGVRSVIAGLCVTTVYYLYRQRNIKAAISLCVVALLGYIFILAIPELNDYFGSALDQSSQNVRGSSIDMRLEQLEGAFKEASDNFMIGHGYSWHSYYMEKYDYHPSLLYFESLFYVVLCDQGIIGIIIWFFCVLLYMKVNKSYVKDPTMLDCLIVYYVSYSCITGEYGYMKLFLIFYIIMFYLSEKKQSAQLLVRRK